MSASMYMKSVFLFLGFMLDFMCFVRSEYVHDGDENVPCTYFGGQRVTSPESSLVNCSWYAQNACCKRTEVTSVFGSMYPLYGANKECSNRINYLMCYFCSPDQHKWYKRTAHVCYRFCDKLFEECKGAAYNGREISEEYADGKAFCEGQKFTVIDGGSPCFDFDPLAFSLASRTQLTYSITAGCIILSVLFRFICNR